MLGTRDSPSIRPAHLHIDLLPKAQEHGLMETFLNRLLELGVRGVHPTGRSGARP